MTSLVTISFEVRRSNVKVGVSLHSSECQSSSYYCDSYRQPRIKHENPPQRFELSQCFLVNDVIVTPWHNG